MFNLDNGDYIYIWLNFLFVIIDEYELNRVDFNNMSYVRIYYE